MNPKHIRISKSRYTLYRQCSKALWLMTYKLEKAVINDALQQRFRSGNAVGEFARSLFGNYVDMTIQDERGRLDTNKMVVNTRKCIDSGVEVICEASFTHDGSYCAVDILKKGTDGYAIYEVKSSTDADKDVYAQDVAYQKYILTNSGVHVTGTYLVCIDSNYVLNGELDIHALFQIQDIGETVAQEYAIVESQIATAKKMLALSAVEPDVDLDVHCHKPYDCAFWEYCSRHLPKQSVFNLYRLNFGRKIAYYQNGITTYDQLQNEQLNDKLRMQVECGINDTMYIDKVQIARFLRMLSYPLYFLDFETIQLVVPEFQGTHPYQQIPFQYSLHYIEKENGELKYKEFLGVSGDDPRRSLAEQLCNDIPMDVCETAYNKAFECTRLKELAYAFPDLAMHLLNIRDHIIDLLIPFQSGWYYVPAMGGSFSIKSVLPALFPDNPKMDYHNLSGIVHNGSEAMIIFSQIKEMSPKEQKTAKLSLLKYCELDTFAMVKIWQKLVEVSK